MCGSFSIVVSIITAVTNAIWKLIASKLTTFERHATWSSYRNHESFKLILFSLLNLSVIGFAKGFFTNPCVLEVMGNQYLIQFIVELLIFNSIELGLPFIKYVIQKQCHKGNLDDIRPEFSISDEYLEVCVCFQNVKLCSSIVNLSTMLHLLCGASISHDFISGGYH